MLKRLLKSITLIALVSIAIVSRAEDVDIFAGGNGVASGNPTLLIVFDNSTNASLTLAGQARIDVARAALAAAIGQLTDTTGQLNIALLAFFARPGAVAGTSGQPAELDGAHVAFAARPMSSATNRAALTAALQSMTPVTTEQPGAPLTLGLEEARRYLGGLTVAAGAGAGALADAAAVDASGATYVSPLQDGGCQKTLIVVIANGPPSSADTALGATALRMLRGGSLPSPLMLPAPYPAPRLPADQSAAGNWLDEFAGVLRRAPFPDSPAAAARVDAIVTYGIALHDDASSADNAAPFASARALILNTAMQGGGRYVDATSGVSLQHGFAGILAEAQAAGASFASPSLPASINQAGTFSNQVYLGMFRPDGNRPRWLGNLKHYRFAYDSSTGALDLVDARNRTAIDPLSGFITPTAESIWSTPQTSGPILPAGSATVDFFANAPAGAGLPPAQRVADAPDGEVVEKGGAAQRLRAQYLGNQALRRIYTCPPAGCAPGAALSTDPRHLLDSSAITCASHQLAFGLDPSTCAVELPLIVEWVRGADNTNPNNETAPGPAGLGTSPIRPSVHGDVVHSRPLLVDYGTSGVVAFYGANDGMLHAVRAGQPASGGGDELWAFAVPETFAKFKRQRDAAPPLQWPSRSSGLASPPASAPGAIPKDYFIDGTLSHYQVRDTVGAVTQTLLFVTARRGGAFVYALDVTDPAAPRFLWRHGARDGSDAAFDDLALTFSVARPAIVDGYPRPVVVFGGGYPGGYDSTGAPLGEDADPPLACVATAQSGCGNRIYVVDAVSGALVRALQQNSGAGGDLRKGVAADLTLVDSRASGTMDRAYAIDVGGGVWRVDFDSRGPAEWRLYKLAQTAFVAARKFLHGADVVVTRGYTAILVGSGDREKPLQTGGSDRFYMLKDRVTASTVTADTSASAASWPIDADSTALDNMADITDADAGRARPILASPNNNGWFYALGRGEKVVNAPLTAAGVVYFGTNQPSAATPGTCTARLGVARTYGLRFNSGMPGRDLDNDGVLDRRDAAVMLAGGGLPPSPVAGLVSVNDAASGAAVLVPFIIGAGGTAGGVTGTPSQSAPSRIVQTLPKSVRKTYWYQRPAP